MVASASFWSVYGTTTKKLRRGELSDSGVITWATDELTPFSAGSGEVVTRVQAHPTTKNLVYVATVESSTSTIRLYKGTPTTLQQVYSLVTGEGDDRVITDIWVEAANSSSVWFTIGCEGAPLDPASFSGLYHASDGVTFSLVSSGMDHAEVGNMLFAPPMGLQSVYVKEGSPRRIWTLHDRCHALPSPEGVTYRDSTSASNGGAGATSIVIPVPVGTVNGDLLLVGIYYRSTSIFPGAPGGWTDVHGATGSNFRMRLYMRIASSEPADYTWTFSPSVRATGGMIAVSGADPDDPIDHVDSGVSSVAGLNIADTLIDTPTPSISTENVRLVGFFGCSRETVIAPDSKMTEQEEVANVGGGTSGTTLQLATENGYLQPLNTNTYTAVASLSAHWGVILVGVSPAPARAIISYSDDEGLTWTEVQDTVSGDSFVTANFADNGEAASRLSGFPFLSPTKLHWIYESSTAARTAHRSLTTSSLAVGSEQKITRISGGSHGQVTPSNEAVSISLTDGEFNGRGIYTDDGFVDWSVQANGWWIPDADNLQLWGRNYSGHGVLPWFAAVVIGSGAAFNVKIRVTYDNGASWSYVTFPEVVQGFAFVQLPPEAKNTFLSLVRNSGKPLI